MAKIDRAKIRNFVTHDVWHVKLDKFPKWQRGMIKILRVSILAVKDFVRKNLALRASALTLYSLLSIVPVVAMIFGIAQGFGLQEYLDSQLKNILVGQPEVLENVMNYAHNLLGSTKGGVIAGLGFVLLLWSVLQVLSNIEEAFNSIWDVQKPRTMARQFTDYLSMMLVAPIFIVISGAANIYITTQVQNILIHLSFLGPAITELIIISLQVLPYITTSVLFFILYLVMPNTRVKPRAALTAGIIAGCVFQLFQWAYIAFQIGVSRYNTIYGSFASIPLFITWLQFSWMIVLVGAEISFSVQNIALFESEKQTGNISHKMRMLYCLYIMHFIAKKFKDALQPPDASEIATKLNLPLSLTRSLLSTMQKCDLLAKTIEEGKNKDYCYVPALDLQYLRVGFIINKIESLGQLKKHEGEVLHQIKLTYIALEDAMNQSSENKHILEF